MNLRKIAVKVGGVSALLGVAACWSHSRWGPKAKATVKEFHRPSYNDLPTNWKEPSFKPRLNYPAQCPQRSGMPWENIDFKKEPEKYMQAILEYCLDGNVESEFVPQKNKKRNWYHAPWMSQTPIGREPIHGLTFERPAPVGYLAETQTRICQSWAVAMYNEKGKKIMLS